MHKQSTQIHPSQYISKKQYKNQKGGTQKRPQSNDTCKESMCHSSYRFIRNFQVYLLYRYIKLAN